MKSSNYLKKIYGNPTDEKYTPGYGVLPIIKYIPEGKIVWCPFDTKHSEFVQKFREGHDYNRHGKRQTIASPDNVSTHETDPG